MCCWHKKILNPEHPLKYEKALHELKGQLWNMNCFVLLAARPCVRDRIEGHNHSDDCVFLSESRRMFLNINPKNIKAKALKWEESQKRARQWQKWVQRSWLHSPMWNAGLRDKSRDLCVLSAHYQMTRDIGLA